MGIQDYIWMHQEVDREIRNVLDMLVSGLRSSGSRGDSLVKRAGRHQKGTVPRSG